MAAVAPVPAMHEQMHQRAEQERKEDQGAKHVSAMLGEQEYAGDHKEVRTRPARDLRKPPDEWLRCSD